MEVTHYNANLVNKILELAGEYFRQKHYEHALDLFILTEAEQGIADCSKLLLEQREVNQALQYYEAYVNLSRDSSAIALLSSEFLQHAQNLISDAVNPPYPPMKPADLRLAALPKGGLSQAKSIFQHLKQASKIQQVENIERQFAEQELKRLESEISYETIGELEVRIVKLGTQNAFQSYRELYDALTNRGFYNHILLDLSNLNIIGQDEPKPINIGQLACVAQIIRSNDGDLKLVIPSDSYVKKELEVVRLDKILQIYTSVPAALLGEAPSKES